MLDNLKAWFNSPLNNGISAFQWVLFVGLLIVATGLWKVVFIHIKEIE